MTSELLKHPPTPEHSLTIQQTKPGTLAAQPLFPSHYRGASPHTVCRKNQLQPKTRLLSRVRLTHIHASLQPKCCPEWPFTPLLPGQPGHGCGENTSPMATSSVVEHQLGIIKSQPPSPGFNKANPWQEGPPWGRCSPPATVLLLLQVPSVEIGKTPPATVTKHPASGPE